MATKLCKKTDKFKEYGILTESDILTDLWDTTDTYPSLSNILIATMNIPGRYH